MYVDRPELMRCRSARSAVADSQRELLGRSSDAKSALFNGAMLRFSVVPPEGKSSGDSGGEKNFQTLRVRDFA